MESESTSQPEKDGSITTRFLQLDDLHAADELRRAEGWNQTLTDWRRLIEHQVNGCFAAESDNRVVGTVTTTVHGGKVAWIGMMLVHRDYRRRGIGTRLMQASLDYLDSIGVSCVKLDATPAGRPVYLQLGFQPQSVLHRWYRPGVHEAWTASGETVNWKRDFAVDITLFGANRSVWCQSLSRGSNVVWERDKEHVLGVGMVRPGSQASYIGPIVAHHDEAGCRIADKLSQQVGAAFWDIPDDNLTACAIAESLGFERVRELYRMWRGDPVPERPTMQFAITGPETG